MSEDIQTNTPDSAQPAAPVVQAAPAPVQAAQPVPQPAPQISTPPKAPSPAPSTLGGYSVKDADPLVQSLIDAARLAAPDVNLERVVGKALANGDPSLIDRDYLKEAFPQGHKQLAQLAEQMVQAVEIRANELQNQVYGLVGGQSQWESAVAVFNQHAPQDVRQAVASLLDSKSPQQIMAGARMVQMFGQQQGLLAQVSPSPLGGAVPAGATQQGLSSKAFKAEVAKVDIRDGDVAEKWAELMRLRMIGKQAGLK